MWFKISKTIVHMYIAYLIHNMTYSEICMWPFQLPLHKPVVINLGEDSSDEDDHTSAQPSASSFLAGLDSFLKAARKSSEAAVSIYSNKDNHTAAQPSASSFLAGLDSFLKAARKSSEAAVSIYSN